jgi:hypothetical protein
MMGLLMEDMNPKWSPRSPALAERAASRLGTHTPRRCTNAGLERMDSDGTNGYNESAHLGRVVRTAATRPTGRAVPAAGRTVQ